MAKKFALLCLLFSFLIVVKADDKKTENFEFSADVDRLMKLIINSLYSNREIFLRELISNAADANDKIRYRSLKEPSILGEEKDFKISIESDREEGTITITDTGIGMTHKELQENLGTVAHSGTQSFIESLQGDSNNLIGQFGVGFYSAFLVSETVNVRTKSPDDEKEWIWESDGTSSYTITESENENPLKRGTQIKLYLKEDALEFSNPDKLKELAKKYSEFIQFPIFIRVEKIEKIKEEIPKEEEEKEKKIEEEKESEEEGEEIEEIDIEDEEPKTKEIERKYFENERINEHKAIWLRSPETITEEEYFNFYKSLSKEDSNPIAFTHFKGEGQVEFRAILYAPGTLPYTAFEFVQKQKNVRLYVQRVLVADQFEDFLPRYLGFIRGVVDSDDLPLNVSREMLQESKLLKQIAKKIIKKLIQMFSDLTEDTEKYMKFWKLFGKHIKFGILEDQQNKDRLAKLLRYESTQTKGGNTTSLSEYVERMGEKQKKIYFIAGDNVSSLKKSHFILPFKKRGIEVLFFTDPTDEYIAAALRDFEGKKIENIMKEGVSLDDEADKAIEKEQRKEFEPLKIWFETLLRNKIENAKVSPRLRDMNVPVMLSTPENSLTANMERIMKAQAMNDDRIGQIVAKKILEINPEHSLIKGMLAKVEKLNQEEKEGEKIDYALNQLGLLLYNAAAINSGFTLEDPAKFSNLVFSVLSEAHKEQSQPEKIENEKVENENKDEL